MATVKTWTYTPAGTVKVEYSDSHTEIMSEGDAIKAGIIKDPGTAKSVGSTKKAPVLPTTPGGYSSGTTIADPFGSGQTAVSNSTVPINGVQVPIAQLLQKTNDPVELGKIRQSLIQYNQIGKNVKSKQSIVDAYTSVVISAANQSMNPLDWMAKYQAAGGGADTASGGPQTNLSIRTYTPDTIRTIADQIYVNQLGRRVTDADLKTLTDQLNAKEKKTPTKTVSTPNAAGSVTTTTTSGGVDEQGLITQQAQQMPEYQRMQNINFSSWLDKAMTTGQPSIGSLTNG